MPTPEQTSDEIARVLEAQGVDLKAALRGGAEEQARVGDEDFSWTSWTSGPPCPTPGPHRWTNASFNASEPALKAAIDYYKAGGARFVKAFEAAGMPVGAHAMIVQDGNVWLDMGWGSSNASDPHAGAPTSTTGFRIGSVSKVLTSHLFMIAQQQGIVAPDADAADFWTEEDPPVYRPIHANAKRARVPLNALASHTGGVQREVPGAWFTNDEPAIFQILNAIPLLFNAYQWPHYSNLGSSLLGRAVARAWKANMTYEEVLEHKITAPLNMTQTSCYSTPAIRSRMAEGFYLPGNVWTPAPNNDDHWGFSTPAGGVYSTSEDLSKWTKVLMDDVHGAERVLGRDKASQVFQEARTFDGGVSSFGAGSWESMFASSFWVPTKGGLTTGFGTYVSVVPELKLSIVTWMNLGSGTIGTLNAHILEHLVPVMLNSTAAAEPLPLPSNVDTIVGTYSNVFSVTGRTPDGKRMVGSLLTYPVTLTVEESPATGDALAMRYTIVSDEYSCLSRFGVGDGGIAYFAPSNNSMTITVPDQNVWGVPMTQT